MGLGRVEPQNEHETFCMTVLGLKLSRRANAVSNLHGHVTPADVGPPLALAGRGGDSHRAHHQRRAHPQLAGLADAAALRPPLPRRLDAAAWASPTCGRTIHNVDPGRAVGNALRPEEPAAGLRPPPGEPPVPPPRRERRGGRGRPEHPRPEHPDASASPGVSPPTSGPT